MSESGFVLTGTITGLQVLVPLSHFHARGE